MAEIQIEGTENETATTVKEGLAEVLGMTTKLKQDTQAYVDAIDPENAMERIAEIKQELAQSRGEVAGYLAEVMTLKDRIQMGSSLEDSKTFLDKVKNMAKAIIGLKKGFASMTDGEILNLLVGDFSARSHYLAERIDHVLGRRDEATKHMDLLKENRRTAIPMMQDAEVAIREMHKEKQRLEARLQQPLSLEERDVTESEYDLLKDTWFVESQKLSEATYTVELSSNVLGVMRIYRNNIDNLLREASELKRTVDLTVDTIKPSIKSIVTVANLSQTVTDTVTSHDVLREYINTVLPKITEMTAYFPELIQDSFNGEFFKEGLQDYLKMCDDKYNLMKDYAQVKMYEKARQTLVDAGIVVPEFDAQQLVFHKPGSLDDISSEAAPAEGGDAPAE